MCTAGAAVAVLLGGAALLESEPARFGWAAAGAASVWVVLEVAYRLWPDKMGFGARSNCHRRVV